MSRLLHIALLPLLAVALLTGCDSNDDETPDAERIVGTWQAERINATTRVGLSVPVYEMGSDDRAELRLSGDGDEGPLFFFDFEPADGRTLSVPGTDVEIPLYPVRLAGSYQLNEENRTIRLRTDSLFSTSTYEVDATLGYRLSGNGSLELIAESPETLALIVGLGTDDATIEALASVVTGGSLSLNKN